jgi:hypothetical protein
MRGLLVDDGRWCTATWRPGRISTVSTRRRASREAVMEVMSQTNLKMFVNFKNMIRLSDGVREASKFREREL